MFPVPVGPTNAASQQFGAFRQQQEQRQYEEEHPDRVVHAERQREAALAHEEDIEDELDAVEAYENTLSRSGRQKETYPNQMTASTFTSPEEEKKARSEPVVRQYQPSYQPTNQVVQPQPQPDASDAGAAVAATAAGPTANSAATATMAAPEQSKERRPSVVGPRSSDEVNALAAQGKLTKQGSQSNLHEDTLHLGQITDADIRNALDPVNQSFSVKDLMEWPEEKLMRLVDHVQPQHLPVLMNRRLQVHEKESAKNFSFHHLTFEKNGETVLNDVSGYMEAGMLVGLLGAPDSGITPLFNILTGRLKIGRTSKVTGDILYDGRKRTADFNRWVGYVVKEDPHLAHMTVFETLYFSARLRLPDMPPKIVRMRVAITLKLLGLSHVANSVVGDGSLRGISGGEKRRVSFGIEMVAGHACIIADLPTNGLDSASAYSLMRTMRFATKIGFSMMASVVQPSPQLLRLFHRVMVMSKGTCIYFGPVSQAEEFFKNAGFIRPAAKALPQFIEEVTLKPELFYKTKRYKELSNNEPMTAAQYQQAAQKTLTPAAADHMSAEQKQMEQKQNDDAYASPAEIEMLRRHAGVNPAAPAAPQSPGHMAIVVHDEGGQHVSKPGIAKQFDSQPPPHGLDEGTAGGQQLKWGNHVLPNNINRSRYDAFILILNAYHNSEFYKEVMSVLDQQKQLQQQHKQHKHSTTANGKTPMPLTDPTHLHTSGTPPADQVDSEERGWGGPGRWWYHYYNSSPWLQLWMNIHRQSVLTVRNTGLWRDTWITSLFMGFFLGSLFYQVGEQYQDVRNRVGLFFFILSYLAFNAVMLVPVLAHQREVYYNQVAGGYYHGFSYYISHFLTQIPIVVVETFILLLPVWGLANLNGATGGREFWYAYLVIGFNSIISRVWMILLASVSPNEVYADVLNTVTNIIFTKLCGYFIAASNIVNGWYWVYTVSYFTYALRGLAKNDINSILIPECVDPRFGPCADPRNCVYSPQEFATAQFPCEYNTGSGALYVIFGIDPSISKWSDFVDLVWFLIAFNVGAMVASTYVNWSTADEPEHPDFGNAMDKKHREMHSDIMRSSKQRQPTSQIKKDASRSAGIGSPQQQQAQIEAPAGYQYGTMVPVAADGTNTVATTNTLATPAPNSPARNAVQADGDTATPRTEGNTAGVDDEENEANIAANTMTYNHRVGTMDIDQKTSPLKTKKAYLEFEDLCYTVMVGKEGGGTEPRMLLNHCFGFAKPSMMTALMGASGAGKSTLLDVLAGKKTGGTISGKILVNGVAPDYAGSFSRVAGYVEQFDSHEAFQTVREAIKFSGRLRLPRKTTEKELNAKVDHVLEVLGISHLQHRMIGSPGFGGVSMEVRKKCTIAVELIMEPALLFLDEPTTGLDSAGAFAVLTSMQLLAQGQGMTVVCTIHQPSAELALMFDNIILMQPGGHVAYFGPFHDLPDWFDQHRLGTLQPGQNPADFALDQVKKAQQGKNVDGEDVNLPNEFRDSAEGQAQLAEIKAGIMPEEERKHYKPPILAESQPPLPQQFVVLCTRFFFSNIRNTSYIGIRFFLALFMGFVVGTVFVKLGYDQQYADQRISAIFVTLIFVMFTANAYLPDIFFLRPIYFREQGSRMYQPLAFYLGRWVADIPIVVGEILLLTVMVYFIDNLNSGNHSSAYGWFFLTMLGVRWVSVFFTWAIGTLVELPTNANTLQSTYFNLQMILTGFILPGPYITSWWVWLYDITYCHWALSFLIANETRSQNYNCLPTQLIPYTSATVATGKLLGKYVTLYNYCGLYLDGALNPWFFSPTSPYGNPPGSSTPYPTVYDPAFPTVGWKCRYQCGYDVMDVYGVNWSYGWMAVYEIVLWCFGIFFAVSAAFFLAYINHIKR